MESVDYYMPINLVREREVRILPTDNAPEVEAITGKIDMVWTTGMLGVLPLFDTLENAKAYAGPTAEILVFNGPKIDMDVIDVEVT